MLHLQRAHARLFGVARLQPHDHLARSVAQESHFVERGVIPFAHESAVALEMRQLVIERSRKFVGDGRVGFPQGGHRLRDLRRNVAGREFRGDMRSRRNAVANGSKVARAATVDHQPRQRTRKVRRPAQPCPQLAAGGGVSDEVRDRVVPTCDRFRRGQRCGQSLCKKPRARRRHRPFDRREQRPAPLARQRSHQFEIAAGGLVDGHGRAFGLAHRRRQRGALAELRALDIGDAGGGSGQFQARERAEGLAGGDREVGREAAFSGRAVEHVARERRRPPAASAGTAQARRRNRARRRR